MKIFSPVFNIVLFWVLLTVTLMFGLYSKDFGPSHTPDISPSGAIQFTRYSVASTPIVLSHTQANEAQQRTFKLNALVEIAEMPEQSNRFTVLFSLNDPEGNSKILLGQWQNYIIVMAGDDYRNRTAQPRLSIQLDSITGYVPSQPLTIAIEASNEATSVTINKQLMQRNKDFTLSLAPLEYSVSLGNTLNRRQGWIGNMSSFDMIFSSCYQPQSELNIAATEQPAAQCEPVYSASLEGLAQHSSNDTSTAPISTAKPESSQGSSESSQSSSWTLHSAYDVLGIEWLSFKSLQDRNTPAFNKDVLINFVGFLPISVITFIAALMWCRVIAATLITIAFTFSISLFIESVQILLPSRTSSIVDLATNSGAGIVTAIICCTVVIGVRWADKRNT